MGTVKMLHGRTRGPALDLLTTQEVLRMHERVFGRLDPQSKRRIVATARMRGWDRSWSDADPIAA